MTRTFRSSIMLTRTADALFQLERAIPVTNRARTQASLTVARTAVDDAAAAILGRARRTGMYATVSIAMAVVAGGVAWLTLPTFGPVLAIVLAVVSAWGAGPWCQRRYVAWTAAAGRRGWRGAIDQITTPATQIPEDAFATALGTLALTKQTMRREQLTRVPVPNSAWWSMGKVEQRLAVAWQSVARAWWLYQGHPAVSYPPVTVPKGDPAVVDVADRMRAIAKDLTIVVEDMHWWGTDRDMATAVMPAGNARDLLDAIAEHLAPPLTRYPILPRASQWAAFSVIPFTALALAAGIATGQPLPLTAAAAVVTGAGLAELAGEIVRRTLAAPDLTRTVRQIRVEPVTLRTVRHHVSAWQITLDTHRRELMDLETEIRRDGITDPDGLAPWRELSASACAATASWIEHTSAELETWVSELTGITDDQSVEPVLV